MAGKRIRTYAVTWRNGAEEIVVANYVSHPNDFASSERLRESRRGYGHIKFYYGPIGNVILSAGEDAILAVRLLSDVPEEEVQPKEEVPVG